MRLLVILTAAICIIYGTIILTSDIIKNSHSLTNLDSLDNLDDIDLKDLHLGIGPRYIIVGILALILCIL